MYVFSIKSCLIEIFSLNLLIIRKTLRGKRATMDSHLNRQIIMPIN